MSGTGSKGVPAVSVRSIGLSLPPPQSTNRETGIGMQREDQRGRRWSGCFCSSAGSRPLNGLSCQSATTSQQHGAFAWRRASVLTQTAIKFSALGEPQMGSSTLPVSYTHLTLPTICSVQISVVAGALKKKKYNNQPRTGNATREKR
eukprot:TRINITY_DN14187_c0_g1_i1.p2 TRINITY_DN14187_c0_g1~~TRINITY_DN14187_c0_g1_i1.p2  ORF type:complete len:147 (-),score=4.16 TRINITY_DN14187_c0_g1_i1:28-468(-)